MIRRIPRYLKNRLDLYRGLNAPPSAHSDPPASAVGPTGGRMDVPGGQPATPAGPSRNASYDPPAAGGRGRGGKVLVGGVAVVAAALAYVFLPKFGFGPGNGKGGSGPSGNNPANPAPALVQAPVAPTPPATQPATAPGAPTSAPVAAAVPGLLRLSIQDESYRVGGADGKEVSLDEALQLAKSATPGAPVEVNVNDTSRAKAEENLKAAFEKNEIPLLWKRDGKPMMGELRGSGG